MPKRKKKDPNEIEVNFKFLNLETGYKVTMYVFGGLDKNRKTQKTATFKYYKKLNAIIPSMRIYRSSFYKKNLYQRVKIWVQEALADHADKMVVKLMKERGLHYKYLLPQPDKDAIREKVVKHMDTYARKLFKGMENLCGKTALNNTRALVNASIATGADFDIMIKRVSNFDKFNILDLRFKAFRQMISDARSARNFTLRENKEKTTWRDFISGGRATKAINTIIDSNLMSRDTLVSLLGCNPTPSNLDGLSNWHIKMLQSLSRRIRDISYRSREDNLTLKGDFVLKFVKTSSDEINKAYKIIMNDRAETERRRGLRRENQNVKVKYYEKCDEVFKYIMDSWSLEYQMKNNQMDDMVRMRFSRTIPVLASESCRVHREFNEYQEEQERARREARDAAQNAENAKELKLPEGKFVELIEEAGAKVLKTVGDMRDRGRQESHCLASVGYIGAALKGDTMFIGYDSKKKEEGSATAEVRVDKKGKSYTLSVRQNYGRYNRKTKACDKLDRMIKKYYNEAIKLDAQAAEEEKRKKEEEKAAEKKTKKKSKTKKKQEAA